MSSGVRRRQMAMRLRAVIESNGKTAAGIEVPPAVVEKLGSGRRPAVRVTIGDHTYPSTIGSMGGRFLVPVSVENRKLAGVAAGDEVDVVLELDTSTRTVDVPPALAAALARDRKAKAAFDSLSFSKQRWFTLQVEGAKTDDTRARRVAKAIETLRA
jgi:hypothetical protein